MRYPKEVHDFIRENVKGRTTAELADLVNRKFGTSFTSGSMKAYKANHKLRSGMPTGVPKGMPSRLFPEEVAQFILSNYKGTGHQDMADRLNAKFGTDYTKDQIKAYYANHHLNSGLTGHFQPGQEPPNKGKKGVCATGCERTWFQKGHTPWNKLPVGIELVKADGYLWRKMGEGAREWRQVHVLNWEAVHGTIPKGYHLTFLDGDKLNCDLENLELVSCEENLELNRSGLRDSRPEVTKAAIALAKVKVAAEKRRKGK